MNLELVAVSIGNTRTRIGAFRGRTLESASALPSDDPAPIARAILEMPLDSRAPIVIASVRSHSVDPLVDHLRTEARGRDIYLFGSGDDPSDLTIPIQRALDDDTTVGQDRLLSALGAYSRAQQACIIVDAGTAITVDFVDGQGIFQGGAIAPGLNMMLEALHEKTAALPSIRFEPVTRPFGKSTPEAMRLGAQAAAHGMVRYLAERYSEVQGAYPQIVATGGDARTLFENDDLIETIIPDLTLIGIQAACAMQLADDDDS